MDVFYYWKNHTQDLKAGRLGYFRSSREKLAELSEGYPDFLWVFKTPVGAKGQVQLLARLRWSDNPKRPFVREPGETYIYYDPDDESSVRFTDSGTEAAVEATTAWVRRHFPKSITANFQGETGQLALYAPVAKELAGLAATFNAVPFSHKETA